MCIINKAHISRIYLGIEKLFQGHIEFFGELTQLNLKQVHCFEHSFSNRFCALESLGLGKCCRV